MKGKTTAALKQWLADGCNRIGEVLILKKNGGFTLVHFADTENTTGLELFTNPEDARAISQYDAAGEYRPLKTAPNLKRGWELRLQNSTDLLMALDYFYPAMAGTWLAFGEGSLQPVHFHETAARQSGMYDIVKKITDEQADTLAGDFCRSGDGCLKIILWQLDAATPLTKLTAQKFDPLEEQLQVGGKSIPLLCSEACNLFVAAARGVVRKARGQE